MSLEVGRPEAPFHCRDIMKCIGSLFNRIDPSSMRFDHKLGPPWSDYNTSRQYDEMFRECRRDHPHRSPHTGEHCVPLGVMIMADKAAVGRMHMTSVYPIYGAFMNQDATVRYKDGVILLAELPTLGKKKMKGERAYHKQLSARRLLHHCLSILYEPLKHFEKSGVYLRDADGKDVWVMLFIAYMNSDNEEQNDQSGLRRGSWPYHITWSCLINIYIYIYIAHVYVSTCRLHITCIIHTRQCDPPVTYSNTHTRSKAFRALLLWCVLPLPCRLVHEPTGGKTFYPSRSTLRSRDLNGSITTLAEQRDRLRHLFVPRTNKSHKAVVEQVFRMWEQRRNERDGTDTRVTALMNTLSILPVRNAYWDVKMAKGGIYAASFAELLHFMPQGVMTNMRKDFSKLLKQVWSGYRRREGEEGGQEWAIDLIEGRMRGLPQFTDGLTKICHFHKGIFALSWVSGEDHISMFQQMVFCMPHPC